MNQALLFMVMSSFAIGLREHGEEWKTRYLALQTWSSFMIRRDFPGFGNHAFKDLLLLIAMLSSVWLDVYYKKWWNERASTPMLVINQLGSD
jgi:hypothetical protein